MFFFKNVIFVNKFCWKDNKTHFNLNECSDPDLNYGVQNAGIPNTVKIDDLGDFDCLIILCINSFYEAILGAEQNILKNHPLVLISLFCQVHDNIQKFLLSHGYKKNFLVQFNDNILVGYE